MELVVAMIGFSLLVGLTSRRLGVATVVLIFVFACILCVSFLYLYFRI